GLGEGDRHRDREVLALAAEPLVRLHVDGHVEVARWATTLARRALAPQPDALAVVNPRRDADLHGPRGAAPARAVAARAGVIDDHAATAAGSARLGDREPPALRGGAHTDALAVRTHPRQRARAGTRPRARRTRAVAR